ncbi:hypothetical protein [Acinetobacter sp. WCHAc060025]|uniref:hypothetical protein n=1 Tax=Acinetobacter sp. WCHAc060025 TaxID=2518625 RepID=UPI001023047C|nr:hypothetical protein [Acinetobacter sp. WCHAc060025]RZG77683.1 hypothetical protein EXE09_01815 [Acinetobacter sp. WCHAc060025]
MKTYRKMIIPLFTFVMLSGCGGGGDDSGSANTPTDPVTPTNSETPKNPIISDKTLQAMKSETTLPVFYKGQRIKYIGTGNNSIISNAEKDIIVGYIDTTGGSVSGARNLPLIYELESTKISEIPLPSTSFYWNAQSDMLSNDGNLIVLYGGYYNVDPSKSVLGSNFLIYNRITGSLFDPDPSNTMDVRNHFNKMSGDGQSIFSLIQYSDRNEVKKYDVLTKKNNLFATLKSGYNLLSVDNTGKSLLFKSASSSEVINNLPVSGGTGSDNYYIMTPKGNRLLLDSNNYWNSCQNGELKPDGSMVILFCTAAHAGNGLNTDFAENSNFVVFDTNTYENRYIKNKDVLNLTGLSYFDIMGQIHGMDNKGFSFVVRERSTESPPKNPTKIFFIRYNFETKKLESYKVIGQIASNLESDVYYGTLARSDVLLGNVKKGRDSDLNDIYEYFYQKAF